MLAMLDRMGSLVGDDTVYVYSSLSDMGYSSRVYLNCVIGEPLPIGYIHLSPKIRQV